MILEIAETDNMQKQWEGMQVESMTTSKHIHLDMGNLVMDLFALWNGNNSASQIDLSLGGQETLIGF